MTERIVIFSWWNGDEWRGTEVWEPDDEPEQSVFDSTLNRVRVRSWNGTFNADDA